METIGAWIRLKAIITFSNGDQITKSSNVELDVSQFYLDPTVKEIDIVLS